MKSIILTTLCAMIVVGCSKPKCPVTENIIMEINAPDASIFWIMDSYTNDNGCLIAQVIPFNPIINHSEIK